jgi:post-segregation antitoxin (ccd killing protein)
MTRKEQEDAMADTLFDQSANKLAVSLSINSDLYAKAQALDAKAQALGIDTSRVAEAAIARAVQNADREQLLADIRKDREVVARYIAEHGDPVAELREMYGTL